MSVEFAVLFGDAEFEFYPVVVRLEQRFPDDRFHQARRRERRPAVYDLHSSRDRVGIDLPEGRGYGCDGLDDPTCRVPSENGKQ